MIHIKKCPICHNSEFSFVFSATDFLISGQSFDVVECHGCGVRMTEPIPDEVEMPRYYNSRDYCPHSELSSGTFEKTYSLIRKVMIARKRKFIESDLGLKPGRLLDVGCGSGAFLNEMRQAGWEVEGVDSSGMARETGQAKYGLALYAPNEWFGLDTGKYDVVTFWHALEHVHRVNEYLKTIRNRLRGAGWVIIAAPNYESYDARHYRHLWAAYDVPRHLYHFHYSSMVTLLNEHGLSVVDLRSLPFDSFYISLLTEKKANGNLLRGMWIGFKSYLSALSDTRASSSLVYVSSPPTGST